MNNLASRKLVMGVVSVVVIGLDSRLGLGLTEVDVYSITAIAISAIGSQGAVDFLKSWLNKGGSQ